MLLDSIKVSCSSAFLLIVFVLKKQGTSQPTNKTEAALQIQVQFMVYCGSEFFFLVRILQNKAFSSL